MPADASFGLIIVCIILEVHKHHEPTQNITQKNTCQVVIFIWFYQHLPTIPIRKIFQIFSAPFFRKRLNICSGLISRAQAEDLLHDQEIGSFLIRLSDKIWGYTISYKCEERIKHFLIDAMNFKKVKFDGNSEKMHKDLHALITFHEVKLLHDHMQCI